MGKLGGIVVGLVIAAVMLGMRFSDKSDTAGEYREQVSVLLETLPDYDEGKDYYEALCDQHHEACFDRHYKIGGKRSGPSFDADAYIHDLLTSMAADAKMRGHEAQATHLAELEQAVVTETAAG